MILAKVVGGLGNQLFIFAASYSLSVKHKTKLFLDISDYDLPGRRPFLLEKLSREFEIAPASLVESWNAGVPRTVPARIKNRLILFLGLNYAAFYRQTGYEYDPGFHRVGSNARIRGLFQSERFFEKYADAVRAAISPQFAFSARWDRTINLVEKPSIALHVRRGDYVNDPANHDLISACSQRYYEEAVKRMSDEVGQLPLCIFSDDPAWCRENLSFPNEVHIISQPECDEPWAELWLMSRCTHHIISNSSFSWWAAWLAEKPGHRVIAPAIWLKPDGRGWDDRDVVPARWQRI